MKLALVVIVVLGALLPAPAASPADSKPTAPDTAFPQEVALRFERPRNGSTDGRGLVDLSPEGEPRFLIRGVWHAVREKKLVPMNGLPAAGPGEFVVPDATGVPVRVDIPWTEVIQVVRRGSDLWIATAKDPYLVRDGKASTVGWPSRWEVRQLALDADGGLWVASSAGLFRRSAEGFAAVPILDGAGRYWGGDLRGVAFDSKQRLWVAGPAGAACRTGLEWTFHEGRDGLPGNDFTGIAAGSRGEVWFGTRRGALRFDGADWAYRQGLRWLPDDLVHSLAVDGHGHAWFQTEKGPAGILRQPMTLAEKAEYFEDEIERFIKRTPLGYLSEVGLGAPGDRSKIIYSDSDNDGLWTSMYGAGECFAFAATGKPEFARRARQAFEALRFLQKVTQGGPHSPPKGYVARTIRPVEWPDPNAGRLERDRETRADGDRLWKVYEPRWPKSADGKWYWKSDTSSDELDGHYFFYARYHDLVADDAEKERVREVVRDLTDHLVDHDFQLVDHDGTVTRWGVFGPASLNNDPNWWAERGLNSLSMLSYLAVAEHVTGDAKYGRAARNLIDQHGYAANIMNPKTQSGFGSGNQSDDEMAFMCFYNLLSYTKETAWRSRWLYAFHAYAALELPETNPFFNFAYAAHGVGASFSTPWGDFPIHPWNGWHEDSLATLRGFPLDRCNWGHHNSHRLDLIRLPPQHSTDLYDPRRSGRGYRVNGRVLPVAERHFGHWNTDPWRLDYGGDGRELASGTVFLLPYYMGLHHGFIGK
ncbi:MAG: hypothetical protein AB7O66_18395 [Limisphaerales bacterium]